MASIGERQVVLWSVRDITERKQLEKERKDRYKTLERHVLERPSKLFHTNKKLKEEIFQFFSFTTAMHSVAGNLGSMWNARWVLNVCAIRVGKSEGERYCDD
nr:hypothetical protein [Desulfosporosinus sp. SRJS8]